MSATLPPIGSGTIGQVNIFRTPASRVSSWAATVAGQAVSRGETPHLNLSRALGASLIGAIETIDISSGKSNANRLSESLTLLTGSPGGRPAGVPAIHSTVNGLANIENGIALLAGIPNH
ncbi:MAG: hypothetical protein ACYDAG_04875 [Chloroflexota bacterium]